MLCSETLRRRPRVLIWPRLSCVSASICQALQSGFSLSFGILLPEVMMEFNESKKNTRKYLDK